MEGLQTPPKKVSKNSDGFCIDTLVTLHMYVKQLSEIFQITHKTFDLLETVNCSIKHKWIWLDVVGRPF